MNELHCRHYLSVQSVAVAADQLQITIATENLIDGHWYSLRLPPSLPALAGTETVFVINGTGGTSIQLADWRARQLLSERLLRGGARLRMVYTKNSIEDLPVFLVREGIVPIP